MRHKCLVEGCEEITWSNSMYCKKHRVCATPGCQNKPRTKQSSYCADCMKERRANYHKKLKEQNKLQSVAKDKSGWKGASEVWSVMRKIST